jgi:hypothetical protein
MIYMTKEFKSDYIRLNLSNVCDFPQMFIEKSKEFYDTDISNLELDIKYYDHVSNSHGCPINGVTNWGGTIEGAPRNYPGWQGQISFFAQNNKNTHIDYASNMLFNSYGYGFRGFHTGSGCPGRINEYSAKIGFYFFLEDFPKLAANKKKWNLLKTFNNNQDSWSSFSALKYS